MATKKLDLGPTGEQVRKNVARLRAGWQYKELSEALGRVGHPIAPLGLRRIEAGERRVSVDDLVALAVVFEVSPLTLLLPEDGHGSLASGLTGVRDGAEAKMVPHNVQWLWGLGEEPLTLPLGRVQDADQQRAEFKVSARPEITSRSDMLLLAQAYRHGEPVPEAVDGRFPWDGDLGHD